MKRFTIRSPSVCSPNHVIMFPRVPLQVSGEGGGVSPRKSVVQSACQYDVRSRVSVSNKVFIVETDKNFDFTTKILLRFLGFGDSKVSIVIEN